MGKNKSINEQITKESLIFYYEKAQELGLVDQILQQGGFKLGAIQTAISRGRVSQAMIDSFVKVIGANENHLTGKEPLSNATEINADLEQIMMTDEQAMTLLDSVIRTQNVGNISKKKTAIRAIKSILNQF